MVHMVYISLFSMKIFRQISHYVKIFTVDSEIPYCSTVMVNKTLPMQKHKSSDYPLIINAYFAAVGARCYA